MRCQILPITFLSTAALLLMAALHQPSYAAGEGIASDSLFLLPEDAPEQKVVQEAQSLGLPIPRIALVPPEMVRIYAERGRHAAEIWCTERTNEEECAQAVTTLQEGPFINHEKGRIWLHTRLPLSKGKSAPMLQELARQIGHGKARQVIIAHEIAHVAFRSMSVVRIGLDVPEIERIDKAMFYDDRFYEAFCNFFGVGLVARLAAVEDADNERQRIAHGLAKSLRIFYGSNRFYSEMADALDNWTLNGVRTLQTWEALAIHATQQASRLSLVKGWVNEK